MSKNLEERANYYLYIDGQAVPVSEQVYRVYQHYERKEEYFSYDLKTEKFQKETATFLPSREDSYERLLEKDRQFTASGQPVEEQAVSSVWLEELLQHLSSDERIILHKDLGGTLRRTSKTVLRSYDSRASGDRECPPRQGCVANVASNNQTIIQQPYRLAG